MSIYAGPTWEIGGRRGPGKIRTRDNVREHEKKGTRPGSNQYPTDHTGSLAAISISIIPPHCVPGHEDSDEAHQYGDRCLLAVARSTPGYPSPMIIDDPGGELILDVPAARALATALTEWANRATNTPRDTTPDSMHNHTKETP